jgi:spermidine synthase
VDKYNTNIVGQELPLELHEWLGTALVPDGQELRLVRHGDEFTIALGDIELMSSRVSASEVALATMTHERLGNRTAQEWLVGGYGMGFTLRAALKAVDADACLTVAELVPEIIEWAKGPMQALTADCLSDPRVVLVYEDVATLIGASRGGYDAILLDVDNGPDWLTRRSNDILYSSRGLEAAYEALNSKGILAVWSAYDAPDFTRRLEQARFRVELVSTSDGSHDHGDTHFLWFAHK